MHLLRKFNEILEGFPSFMHLSILFFYDGACAAIFMIYKTFTCSPRIIFLCIASYKKRSQKKVERCMIVCMCIHRDISWLRFV